MEKSYSQKLNSELLKINSTIKKKKQQTNSLKETIQTSSLLIRINKKDTYRKLTLKNWIKNRFGY